jgi:hypothetical protein
VGLGEEEKVSTFYGINQETGSVLIDVATCCVPLGSNP